MRIVGYIALGWLALSAVVTFGWVSIYELCARRSRAGRPLCGGAHPPRAHAPRARLPKIVAVPTTGEPLPNESEATRTIPPIRNTYRYVPRAATKPRP